MRFLPSFAIPALLIVCFLHWPGRQAATLRYEPIAVLSPVVTESVPVKAAALDRYDDAPASLVRKVETGFTSRTKTTGFWEKLPHAGTREGTSNQNENNGPQTYSSNGVGLASSTALASPLAAPYENDGPYSYEPPDMGLRAWVVGRHFRGGQAFANTGRAFGHFLFKGKDIQVGEDKDFSVDATVGLSVLARETDINSFHSMDDRISSLSERGIYAHYYGTVEQRFPLEAAFGYIRVENTGKGAWLGLPWREAKHTADKFDAMAKISFPMHVLRDDIRLVLDAGGVYTSAKNKAYTVELDGIGFRMPSARTSSYGFFTTSTVEWELEKGWGLWTVRGMARATELAGNNALVTRFANAGAAGMVTSVDFDNRRLNIGYGKGKSKYFDYGVGMDLRFNSGWHLHGEYYRGLGDTFSLELAKWF